MDNYLSVEVLSQPRANLAYSSGISVMRVLRIVVSLQLYTLNRTLRSVLSKIETYDEIITDVRR